MATEFKLPEIGENISQGTVTKVLVKIGDTIKKGQNILELETDKAVVEIPSNIEGMVSEVLVQSGKVIKIGQPILRMENSPASTTASSVAPKISTTISAKPETEGVKPSAASTGSGTKPVEIKPIPNGGAVTNMALPALGENLDKGTVTKILVKTGDNVKKGQNILELETDKAVLEVPSPSEGVIKEILIQNGAVIKVSQPIFKMISNSPAVSEPAPEPSPTKPEISKATPTPRPAEEPATVHVGHMPIRKNVAAAPSVRLFARDIGIDIAQVPGTGPGGRISIDDVKKFAKTLNTSRSQTSTNNTIIQQPLPDFSKWGDFRREAMSNVRRKTAQHLSSAWNTVPHVTQCDKADITELEKLRKASSTQHRKLSITSFLIKILAIGLKKFPQFNSSVDMTTNEVIYKDYINVGVAVDTDRGLLVPVLKNVDRLSVIQISDELTAIAERARNRKTSIEELQGGTFTISNLGGIGGSFFTPIVNWPEVAILGVSRGIMEPVYIENQFVPRLMLPLSLSYDHRIIDGADGSRFIRWIVLALEGPSIVEGLSV